MQAVNIGDLGKLMRKPYYAIWRIVRDRFFMRREYVLHVPYGERIYAPWFNIEDSSAFSQTIRWVQDGGRLGVSLDRCFVLYQLARESASQFPNAAMAECGVYTGGTAQLLAIAVEAKTGTQTSLHLFDTFEGMPETSQPERDYHKPGDFSDTSLTAVQERLSAFPFCRIHPGFIPNTLANIADVPSFSFVHIDLDIYQSTKDSLEFFWPKMLPGGVLVFDDYGYYPYRHAARRAVDDFFAEHKEVPWPLPTGQAIVRKQ